MKNITAITFTPHGIAGEAPNIHGSFYLAGREVHVLPDVGQLLMPEQTVTLYTFFPPIAEADKLVLWFAHIMTPDWTSLDVQVIGDTIATKNLRANTTIGRYETIRLSPLIWPWIVGGAGILLLAATLRRRR